MNKDYTQMSNEEMCVVYQKTLDNDLFEYFLAKNEGLIYYFIGNYLVKFPESETNDILQHCRVAMWDAMRRFDPNKGFNFSTYYYYYARKGLEQYLRDANFGQVRIPAHARAAYHKDPKYTELIDGVHVCSLDTTLESYESEITLGETLEDPNALTGLEYINITSNHADIKKALQCLSAREMSCVIQYFGLDGGGKRTLEEIGQQYGVTRERIRQIIKRALEKLREKFTRADFGLD